MTSMLVVVALFVLAYAAVKTYDVLSGRDLLRDLVDKRRLGGKSVEDWHRFWEKNTDRSDTVICLTTIPSRLGHIEATLKSLLYQTRAPARIRLHLPRMSRREKVPYVPADWLTQLKAVEIVPCEDYGPATKLIPALLDQEPEQKLLIVDDDKLYPPGMVEHFDRAADAFPDAALGSSGWTVPADLTDRTVTLWRNFRGLPPARLKATRIDRPRRVDILQGHSGYLIRPRFFEPERLVNDYAGAPQAAFYVDDVWISAYCRVKKFVIPARRFCFVSWRLNRLYDWTSLGHINDGAGDPELNNNTIMIRHLKDSWMGNKERDRTTVSPGNISS
jgi:hypothetical protein